MYYHSYINFVNIKLSNFAQKTPAANLQVVTLLKYAKKKRYSVIEPSIANFCSAN